MISIQKSRERWISLFLIEFRWILADIILPRVCETPLPIYQYVYSLHHVKRPGPSRLRRMYEELIPEAQQVYIWTRICFIVRVTVDLSNCSLSFLDWSSPTCSEMLCETFPIHCPYPRQSSASQTNFRSIRSTRSRTTSGFTCRSFTRISTSLFGIENSLSRSYVCKCI